jgi:hypothetical protein
MAKISRIELHVKIFNGVAPSQAFAGCGSCGPFYLSSPFDCFHKKKMA